MGQIHAKAGERVTLKSVIEEKKASQEARIQRIESMKA
jgi:hypothetical protein